MYTNCLENSTVSIIDGTINNNIAGYKGGGIDVFKDIDSNTITENETFTCNLIIKNMTINNNKAAIGGGLHFEGIIPDL